MSSKNISRRDLFLASGGILLAGGVIKGWGQEKAPGQTLTKDLIFRTTDPRNAEPELAKLVQSWITPTPLFYVRSHGTNPVIDPSTFRLQIEGLVRKPSTLSLEELAKFERKTTTMTLTCAGSRRVEFNREAKVGGVQWEAGAIGNATWSGFSLADVLRQAELLEDAKHVWFEGLDQIADGDHTFPFGGSIPINKAMIADGPEVTLLADNMNDAPLTPDHGFPLRTVVPGYIGARSVKWLGKIVVSDRPSPNHFVADAYKIVTKTEPIDWEESGPIYRYPINAAICTPKPRAKVSVGTIELTGYALPTGRADSKIKQVLVSADQGKTWMEAEMTSQDGDFCWQLWKAQVPITADTKVLTVKASDTSGGFMPARAPWNAKGYLQNSWYRLPVQGG
jgi:sulfite oxidase